MSAAIEEKPFHLQGNFAPVTEEVTALKPEVIGSIPAELNGLYVRNGANPITGESDHWFLGNGMVHGVKLEDGQASWYRNRYVKTKFLEDPSAERISSDGTFDYTMAAANTSIISHAGQILALEEGAYPFAMTPELETVGPHTYGGKLKTPLTAHPKICATTGELVGFAYGQLPPYLTYLRISPDGKLVQSEEITVGGPTMMHDFAITENYALFMDLPVVFDLQLAIQGIMPFHWSDDYPARVGIMPRTGGDSDVKWFDVDPCYVFHGMNAFEKDGQIHYDVCRSSEIWREAGAMFGGDAVQSFHRWSFDLESGKTSEQTIDDRAMDFPKIADARVGLEHRYGFTLSFEIDANGTPSQSGLTKLDIRRGTSEVHEFPPGLVAGEPTYVPAVGSDPAGDEGWLMFYLHDENAGETEFVILDANNFGADPVARVKLPQRVPYGFHGSWMPDSAA
jgi:carotenoid cleavage dioxygenase-like enzyme